MSFPIFLQRTDSEQNEINKQLAISTEIAVNLKDNCDIINPTFLISGSVDNLSQYNYIRVPTFNRYYFIKSITQIRHNLYEIHAHVDVLMSFKNEILNNTAILDRAHSVYDDYLQDTNIQMESYKMVQTKKFNYTFIPETSLLLTVLGGGN